jgi:hypothetical protein
MLLEPGATGFPGSSQHVGLSSSVKSRQAMAESNDRIQRE